MAPEQLLTSHILRNHSVLGRPVADPSQPLNVSIQLYLFQFIDMVS